MTECGAYILALAGSLVRRILGGIVSDRTVLMAHPLVELYGSDRMYLESVRAMVEAGWRVVATVPGEGPITPLLRDSGAEVVVCPTPVLRKAALRPAGFARLVASTIRALGPTRRLLRAVDPDVVYVNTVVAPLWMVYARMTGRRVVAHVHEAEDSMPRILRLALALPLLAAHIVVVNSQATAASVTMALPRLRARIRLVYNGVPGPPDRLGNGRGQPHRPARLVVVGRLSPRKGTDTAVEAMASLRGKGRDVELRLVGSVFTGYEWFEDSLRARARELGVADHVVFMGFQDEVWSAYADADVALVPSRYEPFGNTSVEAQLAGIPVVVTDAQGLPETVDHGKVASVVPADDAGAFAAAVEEILDDWPDAVTRAGLARQAAESRFGTERYRAEIAELVTGSFE